jgi:hypothetical protein
MVLNSKFNNTISVKDLSVVKKETSQNQNIQESEVKSNRLTEKPMRFKFNIRGTKFDLYLNQLDKFAESRLSKLRILLESESVDYEKISELCDDFDSTSNELYFNRDPFVFNSILNFFLTGKLHYNRNTCPFLFQDELEYWGLNGFLISTCCEDIFDHKSEMIKLYIKKRQEVLETSVKNENFSKCWFPKVQKTVWNIVEKPRQSMASKVSR